MAADTVSSPTGTVAAIFVFFLFILIISSVCIVGSVETLVYLDKQVTAETAAGTIASDTSVMTVKKWQTGFVIAFISMAAVSLLTMIALGLQLRYLGKKKSSS
jgi:hypothetical protein